MPAKDTVTNISATDKIVCGEFLVIDLDDAKQVKRVPINTDSMTYPQLQRHNDRLAKLKELGKDAPKDTPRLTIDELIKISADYAQKHPGKKLAHSFPGNDVTAKILPWEQHTAGGDGLAIPYEVQQAAHYKDKTTDPPIWVVPVPATFRDTADKEKQKDIIRHYLASLYYQVGLGNGICVPVRDIEGYSGSRVNAQKEADNFPHPKKPAGASALKDGKEYAWGAGVDPYFCANHGNFLEDELNKLDKFMHDLKAAENREQQEKIIKEIHPDYQNVFMLAIKNPQSDCYSAFGKTEAVTRSLSPASKHDISSNKQNELPAEPDSVAANNDDAKKTDYVTDEKLTPIFNQLCKLLKLDLAELEKTEPNVAKVLQAIKVMEIKNNAEKLKEEINKFLAFNTEDKYWQAAKQQIEQMEKAIGDQYNFDLKFTEDKLDNLNKLDFRHKGAQYRHITPVSLIMHLFRRALIDGMSIQKARETILMQLEMFKPDVQQKDAPKLRSQGKIDDPLQDIFDYFRNPKLLQQNDHIKDLLKFVAHFYNESSQLVMNDNYIPIPYKTFDIYVVPTTDFGGSLYIHNNEGNFITAQNKILTAYNAILAGKLPEKDTESAVESKSEIDELFNLSKEAQKKVQSKIKEIRDDKNPLSGKDLNIIIYSIYAIFDYLPLPADAIDPDEKNLNAKCQRYKNEPVERLYDLAAFHLHIVFSTYPEIAKYYRKEITEGFINYLINGVAEKDLLALGLTKEKLQKDIDKINEGIKKNNQDKTKSPKPLIALNNLHNGGHAVGFNKQYKLNDKEFIAEINSRLQARNRHNHTQSSAEESFSIESSEDTLNERNYDLTNLPIYILYENFINNKSLGEANDLINDELSQALQIESKVFSEMVQNRLAELKKDERDEDYDFIPKSMAIFNAVKEAYYEYLDKHPESKEFINKISEQDLKNLLNKVSSYSASEPSESSENSANSAEDNHANRKISKVWVDFIFNDILGGLGLNTDPTNSKPSASKDNEQLPVKMVVDKRIAIYTEGDGNCAFNADALWLADLVFLDQFSEKSTGIPGEKRQAFYEYLVNHDKIKLLAPTQEAFKSWLESKSKLEIQNKLSVVLREFAVDSIVKNYEEYRASYEGNLFYAFNLYLTPNSNDRDDTFIHHKHIKNKFDTLLVEMTTRILKSDLFNTITSATILKNRENLNNLLEKNTEQTPALLRSWWFVVKNEITKLQEIAKPNQHETYLEELKKLDVAFEAEIKEQEKENAELKTWWHNTGKHPYFSEIRQNALHPTHYERWGSEVEISALANLFGVNVIWLKYGQEPGQLLGPGHGMIPLNKLGATEDEQGEMIRLLSARGLGERVLGYFKLATINNLEKKFEQLTKEEFEAVCKCLIDDPVDKDKPITEIFSDNPQLIDKLVRLGTTTKINDKLYFIRDEVIVDGKKIIKVDVQRIINYITILEQNIVKAINTHYIAENLPTLTISNNGVHWTYERTFEINNRLNGKFTEPSVAAIDVRNLSIIPEEVELALVKLATKCNYAPSGIGKVNNKFSLRLQDNDQVMVVAKYLLTQQVFPIEITDGGILFTKDVIDILIQKQTFSEIAEIVESLKDLNPNITSITEDRPLNNPEVPKDQVKNNVSEIPVVNESMANSHSKKRKNSTPEIPTKPINSSDTADKPDSAIQDNAGLTDSEKQRFNDYLYTYYLKPKPQVRDNEQPTKKSKFDPETVDSETKDDQQKSEQPVKKWVESSSGWISKQLIRPAAVSPNPLKRPLAPDVQTDPDIPNELPKKIKPSTKKWVVKTSGWIKKIPSENTSENTPDKMQNRGSTQVIVLNQSKTSLASIIGSLNKFYYDNGTLFNLATAEANLSEQQRQLLINFCQPTSKALTDLFNFYQENIIYIIDLLPILETINNLNDDSKERELVNDLIKQGINSVSGKKPAVWLDEYKRNNLTVREQEVVVTDLTTKPTNVTK
jgi:hypothetical protein